MGDSITSSYFKIKSKKISWLWYPYIPFGKITIVQGDPGEGKTSFILFLASILSNNKGDIVKNLYCEKSNVIYESAEDGKEDTIKPKIQLYKGDSKCIHYINGHLNSFDGEILENAIKEVDAKLLILDPLQAFLGGGSINNVNDLRPIFDALAKVAEKTNCAIVLVGHMNKNSGSKDLYRSLGSIDIVAIARSVLLVKKDEVIPNRRNIFQIKNNLASSGSAVAFEFNENGSIEWIGEVDVSSFEEPSEISKLNYAINILKEYLVSGPKECPFLQDEFKKRNISERTLREAKKRLSVKSFRKAGKWYWSLGKEGGDSNG